MQDKLNEYEERILKLNKQLLSKDATLVEMAPAPLQIRKQWMRNIGKKGGSMTWMPHVDKLILELLANRTQPSCVQSNILVVTKVIHPTWDVIKELPSRRYIRSARTVLTWVAKSLAAMRIGNSNAWKQMHTDETSRRHTSIVNCIMSIIGSDNKLQTICLSGAIIVEDGTVHHQALALVDQFRQSDRMSGGPLRFSSFPITQTLMISWL